MSQLNILLVDDNYDLAEAFSMFLEQEGHQVTLAYNGNDGIEVFAAGKFDVVLVDFKLPDINGLEVSREIRRQTPGVAIMAMTGFRIEQIMKEVADNGDVEILRKPVENDRVLEILEHSQKESIVLIVDDEPDYSRCLTEYLTDKGEKTMLVRNSKKAIDGVLSGQVEVLLLDLQLPVINALEVYLELKQQDRAVKTIIITGLADEKSESIDVLRSVSVTGCLFKPLNPKDLLRTLNQLQATRWPRHK